MSHKIVTLGIGSERDMVAVRQRAREIADTLGFGLQDQVRIATAVSELARTVLATVAGGTVEFSISDLGRGARLQVRSQCGTDRRSAADPDGRSAALARAEALESAGRLMDSCVVDDGDGGDGGAADGGDDAGRAGARQRSVVLGKALPPSEVIDARTLIRLADRIAASPVASSFTEVTLQNKELLDTLSELRSKQDALLALTEELERTNRGVVALYAEIEEKAESLRQADIHKDEFLATLAHELRNPLAPIRNAVEVMRRVAPSNVESHARAQQVISRQVDHLARLVDDLLDVARISRGKVTLQQAAVDVAQFMQTAVETIRPFIEARGHVLTVLPPVEQLPVMGDAVRLAQIIGNLLNNAAKYTARGGRIALAAGRSGAASVRITVRDNGIGLSEARKDSIFDMFSQGDTAPDRAQDGLGIGLSLVRQLVTLHGGRVWVDSDGEGHGSCFIVELPLIADVRAPASAGPMPLSGPAADTPLAADGAIDTADTALTVLLVDDNYDSVTMTAMMLEACGHRTLVAFEATAALALALAHLPDVILLDIGLPGDDGYAVARTLRLQPTLAGVRLIAMTGYGTKADQQKAREAGFDHHVVKPVNAERLIGLVAGTTFA